jgi:hypothetical protein
MKRFRFHLGTLVILVLLLGVGLAALRESSEVWDSSIFSITLGVLLISILLAIHRTEKKRAFWLGFALFGSAYLGQSFVPSIESRLITTRTLGYLDSKMPWSIPGGLGYFEYVDSSMDLYFVNNMQTNSLVPNKGNGDWIADVTASGSKPAWFSDFSVGTLQKGSIGTTENFIRIGHSLLALIAALLGGQLSRFLHTKNPLGTPRPVPATVSMSNDPGM